MKYRIAQVALTFLGVFFLGSPTNLHNNDGNPAAALGVIFGLTLRLAIAVGCFVGAFKLGQKAKKPTPPKQV